MIKPTSKPRRVKAEARTWQFRNAFDDYCGDEPIWSLPRTAAAYDAMVEQMAKAKARSEGYRYTRFMYGYQNDAIAALRAIGITRPKE